VVDKVINLNQQLNDIEQLFASGQIKKGQKDLRKLNSQYGKGKPIPSKFKHKFQRLNFTAKEYDDWAEFATSDKRSELISKVNSLEGSKLEPRKLANEINSLQKQWQNLDQHGKTASKEKWATFKEACEKAWAPCKDYFAVLESKKEENKEKKLGLLKEVEAFPAGKTEDNITVIQIVMFLKGIHDKWKTYSPVPDKDFSDLNNKFKESRDGVNKLLEKVEIYNRGLKEEVIAEVQGLSKEEIDESVAKIRELQDKWRTLGPAGKKLDPQINEQFEKACDEFLLIKDKELDESRGIMEGIIKQLRDKAIAPGEAEQQFAELENLQGTQEEKKFKKAIKDFAMLQKNEKAQEKLKSYQDLFEELIENGSDKVSKDLIPSFVNGKPSESMDLNEATIRFQMFAGLDPVGPKEMVSKIKFEELKNRFAEKNIDMSEKLVEHFTNLVYSSGKSDKTQSADVKKAMIKALKKVENLLP
jgi:exonuclease SbcC